MTNREAWEFLRNQCDYLESNAVAVLGIRRVAETILSLGRLQRSLERLNPEAELSPTLNEILEQLRGKTGEIGAINFINTLADRSETVFWVFVEMRGTTATERRRLFNSGSLGIERRKEFLTAARARLYLEKALYDAGALHSPCTQNCDAKGAPGFLFFNLKVSAPIKAVEIIHNQFERYGAANRVTVATKEMDGRYRVLCHPPGEAQRPFEDLVAIVEATCHGDSLSPSSEVDGGQENV